MYTGGGIKTSTFAVSLLTLMAAVVRQVTFKQYRYPSEDITIN